MILVCPDCSARYLLSSAALGSKGRTVRCAKCNHEWHAEPPPVERDTDFLDPDKFNDEEDDFDFDSPQEEKLEETTSKEEDEYVYKASLTDKKGEEIPEAVKPLPNNKAPAKPEDVARPYISLQAQFIGFGAALLLFSTIVLSALIFRGSIVSMWQPSALIFEMAGMPVHFKGEGLVIESLSSDLMKKADGKDTLVVKGRVVNLTKEAIEVPKIRAVLRSTNGEDGDSWTIDPPVTEVGAGESFAFTTDYPEVPRGVGSINLTFVPTVKGS